MTKGDCARFDPEFLNKGYNGQSGDGLVDGGSATSWANCATFSRSFGGTRPILQKCFVPFLPASAEITLPVWMKRQDHFYAIVQSAHGGIDDGALGEEVHFDGKDMLSFPRQHSHGWKTTRRAFCLR